MTILISALSLFWVTGCNPPTAIGKVELQRSFPPHSELEIRTNLEREGKLHSYERIQQHNDRYLLGAADGRPREHPQ
jgi:hypothetical protein